MSSFNCGHGCLTDCANGGGCIYNHERGICVTFCINENKKLSIKTTDIKGSHSGFLEDDGRLDISFSGVPPSEIVELLQSFGVKKSENFSLIHRFANLVGLSSRS